MLGGMKKEREMLLVFFFIAFISAPVGFFFFFFFSGVQIGKYLNYGFGNSSARLGLAWLMSQCVFVNRLRWIVRTVLLRL